MSSESDKKEREALNLRLLTEEELQKLEKKSTIHYDAMDASNTLFRIMNKKDVCIGFLSQLSTSRAAIIKESLCNLNDL
jgi:hypothetical protein